MLDKVVAALEKAAKDAVLEQIPVAEDDRLIVDAKQIKTICKALKTDAGLAFDLLVELTCVDYLGEEPRFEMIYQLYSMKNNYRLRLKARLPEGEEIDTVSDVWRVANPLEREVWDMFGVRFTGHPNLKRLLMYEEFEGHPLRKDYPLKKHQPIIPLIKPIEVQDDPPYMWTEANRQSRLADED